MALAKKKTSTPEERAAEPNPFLRRLARTSNLTASHIRAPKQEKALAKRLGGQRTPRSGAGDIKGDVRLRRLLRLEAKTTKNKSFSVTLEMVNKIAEAGMQGDELPAIVIEFTDGFGRVLGEVAVVPTYALDELCERHNGD